jgi:hypothetical protein
MKILKLILENYAGIINGIQRNKIELDFSKCDKKIIMLLGLNGKGKSTILSSLHPYSETFNDKYPIKEGKEGYKEIHYLLDNNDLIQIRHIYSKDNKISSFISINNEELNKKGGVRTFEELVTSNLNVTKEFFKLLFLSSEGQSFIKMNSSSRKEFIGKFMPSIDDYLQGFNNVNKKILDLNKRIKFLTEDIQSLGDLDSLIQKLTSNTSKLHSLNLHIKNLNKEKNELEFKFKKANENIYRFKDIITNYETIQSLLNQKIEEYNNIISLYPKTFKDKNITEIQEMLEITKNNLKDFTNKFIDLNNLVNLQELTINQNNNIIAQLDVVKKKYNLLPDNEIKIICDKLNNIVNYNNDIELKFPVFKSTDFDMESIVDSYLNQLNININSAFEKCMNNFKPEIKEFLTLDDFKLDHAIYKSNLIQELITDIKESILIKTNERDLEQNELDVLKLNNELITLCKDKTCKVYAKNKEMSNKENTIKLLNKEIKILENTLFENNEIVLIAEQAFEFQEGVNKLLLILKDSRFINIFNICKSFYPNINVLLKLKNTMSIYNFIDNNTPTEIYHILENFQKLIDIKSQFSKYIYNKTNIELFTNKIKDFNDSSVIIEEANNKAIQAKLDNSKLIIECELNKNKLKELEQKKINLEKKEKVINELIFINNEISLYKKDFQKAEIDYQQCKDDDILLKSITEKLVEKDKLINIEEKELKLVEGNINELNLAISKYEDITNKLKEVDKKLSSFMYIKNALDLKTGIPLVLLGNYLEDIKLITNELLKVALKNFSIDFHLTDKEFTIPTNKNGEKINDAFIASSGEKALIQISLSLGIIINAIKDLNTKYNIPILDEIDGQLDINNKMPL